MSVDGTMKIQEIDIKTAIRRKYNLMEKNIASYIGRSIETRHTFFSVFNEHFVGMYAVRCMSATFYVGIFM